MSPGPAQAWVRGRAAPARPHLPLPRVESAGKERMAGRPGRRQGLDAGTVGEQKVRVLDYGGE